MKRASFASIGIPLLLGVVVFLWLMFGKMPLASLFAPRADHPDDVAEVKVWVNTRTGLYQCPGAKTYGDTKSGRYIGQREALQKGYQPLLHEPCR
jgi:hypothetical protein